MLRKFVPSVVLALALVWVASSALAAGQAVTLYDPYANNKPIGVTGNPLVTTATVTPSGTQNVNVTQINGAAPSLTNPIFIANAEAADVTGTFTNGTQTASVTNSNADGYATSLISLSGTYNTASGVFEASPDSGATYYPILCTRSDGSASETSYTGLTNTNRQWSCATAGNDTVRVRSTAVASGTVNVNVGISAPTTNSGVVSGTVSINQTTPGTTNGVNVADRNGFNVLTSLNAFVSENVNGAGVASLGVGSNTNVAIQLQGSADGSTFVALPMFPLGGGNPITTIPQSTNGQWTANVSGLQIVKAVATAVGATPTAVAVLNVGAGSNYGNYDAVGNDRFTVCGANSACAPLATAADAQTNSIGLFTNSQCETYNGSTWDRCHGANETPVTTGLGVQTVEEGGRLFNNITTAATTTVKSGAGYLHEVCINKTVASATVTMFNNTAASGATIGTITMPAVLIQSATCLTYDIAFSTGLTIVTVGAQDITVSYR